MNMERDKDYETLLENYEDAVMRLVMYRVAQEDGKRLLKEAEQLENSGFKVPKELDEKCMKLIQAGCAPQEHNQSPPLTGDWEHKPNRRLSLKKVGQILVAAILAAMLLFGAAYASNEQFRVNVLNFFLELEENGTWFFFQSKESGEVTPNSPSAEEDFPFEFTYIPDEHELISKEAYKVGVLGTSYFCRYGDPNDDSINFFFEIIPISEGTSAFIDTEDAIITNININGHDGQLIQKMDPVVKKECYMYFWFDFDNRLEFIYNSIGVSPEESLKIFNGIILNGEKIKIF